MARDSASKSAENSVAVADDAPTALGIAEPTMLVAAEPATIAETAPNTELAILAKPEVAAPAEIAGPVKLLPRAANAKVVSRVQVEIKMPSAAHPEIPRFGITPTVALLDPAPRLSCLAAVDAVSAPWRSRAGRLEIRDFARAAPTLDLGAALAAPRVEKATLPAKVVITPAPSRNGTSLWIEPQQDFRDRQVQIGEFASLDLPTTGLETWSVDTAPPAETGTDPEPETIATAAAEPRVPAKTSQSDTASISEIDVTPMAESVTPMEGSEPERVPISENTSGNTSETISIPDASMPVAELAAETDSSTAAPEDAPTVIPAVTPIAEPQDAAAIEPWQETKVTAEAQLTTEVCLTEAQLNTAACRTPETEPRQTSPAQQPLADSPPARATQPAPVVLAAIPGGKAKALQIFTSTLKADVAGRIPLYETLPLRAVMILGRADASGVPGRADASVAKAEPARPPAATESAKVGPGASDKTHDLNKTQETAKEPGAKPPVKWAAPRAQASPVAAKDVVAKDAVAKDAAAKKDVAKDVAATTNAAKEVAVSSPPAAKPVVPEVTLVAKVKTPAIAEPSPKPPVPNRVQPGSERELAEVNREQAKLNREQAELNRAQAELNREQARRNRELAKTAEKVAASTSSGALTGGSVPLGQKGTKPASLTSLSLNGAPQTTEETDLGLPVLDLEALKERFPLWAKITAAAACALLLAGGIWFYTNHNRAPGPETLAVSSLSGGAGPEWVENFSPDAKHPRTISVLRASEKWADYSIEFSASVDVRALGWVFRAKDPANFYVGRIEQEKTLAGMTAAFVYFPVLNGVPQPAKRSNVALPAAPGTIYKIRFDVFGDQFTAWIQDRKVEEWTDSSLRSGGAGLYSESGERALLAGPFRMIPRTPAR